MLACANVDPADLLMGPITMQSLAWSIFGLVLLFGAIGIGFMIWQRRINHRPSRIETMAVLVLLSVLAGGFLGAFAWWPNYPDAFSWPLPGLAARMLAVAGWSFALAAAMALMRPNPKHLRLVLLMLWVYLGPLTVAILTLHLNRFDFSRPVVPTFFIIVVVLLVSSSIALLVLPRQDTVPDGSPNQLASSVLWIIAGVAGLWAVALFIKPDGPVPLIWSWPHDALTTRLIASMFLTIAVGAYAARLSQRLSQTVFLTTLAYGIGVIVAGFAHVMTAKPSPTGYVSVTLPKSYMVVWGALGFLAIIAFVNSKWSEAQKLR